MMGVTGKVTTFSDLASEGLKGLYDAEYQITESLPKMVEAATAVELKNAFQTHLQQTEDQIKRLDQIFTLMGETPERKPCVALQGLIAEGSQHIKEIGKGPLLDAALIAAGQTIEHYEMAVYGSARALAQQAGQEQVVSLLQTTLGEEEQADKILTGVAETVVNRQAMAVA